MVTLILAYAPIADQAFSAIGALAFLAILIVSAWLKRRFGKQR